MQDMQTKLCFLDYDPVSLSTTGIGGGKLLVAAFLGSLKHIHDLREDASLRLCDHSSLLS